MTGREIASVVSAIAAPAGGRLLVVSPAGLYGSPYEPDFLDGVEFDGAAAVLSLGGGHAVYRLEAARLLEHHAEQALLAADALTATFVPYGRAPRPGTTQRYTDAELLVTSDRRVAVAATRTRGTPAGADG